MNGVCYSYHAKAPYANVKGLHRQQHPTIYHGGK